MQKSSILKSLGKKSALAAAVVMSATVSAFAAAPNVTTVVSDIGDLADPIALVGGAYISLKVFQRGWRIIKGFI